jgi:hypothetical protein
MIFLPKDFDANDWFVIVCLPVIYIVVWRLPRILPKSVSLLIMFFSLSLAKGADNTLGSKPLDLYDTNEMPKFDLTDLLTWGLYPAFGYLFIYMYQRFLIRGYALPMFVLTCAVLGTGFEYICVQFDVFAYKKWILADSFVVYLLSQALTILFFEWCKRSILAKDA